MNSELQKKLYGRFDAVTFMDTVEHYVSIEDRNDLAKQNRIYTDMCYMTSQLLNMGSKSKRVFISCLHQTRKPRYFKFYVHIYFMDKMYSGNYPFLDEGPLVLCKPWFDVVNVDDKTEDYRLTGVHDQQRFSSDQHQADAEEDSVYRLDVFAGSLHDPSTDLLQTGFVDVPLRRKCL